MPRVRTAARQRRGRCFADTDLMTRSPLSKGSNGGVVASPSATSIRAPTSGLSRSSGESRATVRTTLPLPRRIERRTRQFRTTLQKAQVHTSGVGRPTDKIASEARRVGPNPITKKL